MSRELNSINSSLSAFVTLSPVAAPTVLLIAAASAGPVTSSTTNSGGTRHLNGTPLVPMPLVNRGQPSITSRNLRIKPGPDSS